MIITVSLYPINTKQNKNKVANDRLFKLIEISIFLVENYM